MPVPPNLTPETATDLAPLPASITLDVTDAPPAAGGNNVVWFKYTAVAGEIQIGLLAFAASGFNYQPEVFVYLGPASSPVAYPSGGDSVQIDGLQTGISVPVTAGTTYYFKVVNAGSTPPGTDLVLTAETASRLAAPSGSLLVPDDVDGFNACVVDPASGAILRYVTLLANGDFGVVNTTGVMLFDHPAPTYLALYDPAFTLIRSGNGIATAVSGLGTDMNQTFYIAQGRTNPTVSTMSPTGVIGGTTWTPTITLGVGENMAMAPSRDNTILYYTAGRGNQAIKRWDLVNNIALTDLVATPANHFPLQDLLVLSDGTIVAGYTTNNGTHYYLKHYAANGTTLHTYNDVNDPRTNRLAMAIDDPNSFWAWYYPGGDGGFGATGRFSNIKVSDGSRLNAAMPDLQLFTNGVNDVAYSIPATSAIFGPSFSCGFLVLRGTNPSTTVYTIRRQRRWLLPSSPDNKRMSIPTLELLMRTGIGLTAGPSGSPVQGEDPQMMLRISKDGGNTWGFEQRRSAGTIGHYKDRVRWLRATGQYRNAVAEVTSSDPVDVQWIAALGDPTEGSS